MADKTQLKIIKQGVNAWNQWRRDHGWRKLNLRRVNLRWANLSGANLSEALLSEALLSGAQLRGADLQRADLHGADLHGADLHGADLRGADLHGANFYDTTLRGVDLSGANLCDANFSNAKLLGANLRGTNLRGVTFHGALLNGADLGETDLSETVCEQANFSNANLKLVRLLNANLNGATLSGAHLWETQRAGWSIKGVICESIYWDKQGKELTTFSPGEFERLYAEKVRVLIRYPNGISPLEIITLPALIQHLEASSPGCKLRFESIQDGPGGAVVTIVVEDAKESSSEQMELLRAAIQAEAEQKAARLRTALESEKESVLLLSGEVRALERTVDKFLSRPTFYLERGDANVGDEYNVGQAGAVGPHAHAHDMTFQQIGGNIERALDLSQLAGELATLREAMSREAQETEHYIALGEVAKAEEAAKAKDSSKVAENLKAAGTWALDVATKIGTSLASEALKESLGIKK